MKITLEEVREAIRKDDFHYVNKQIEQAMAAAKAAFLHSTGYQEGDEIPQWSELEFESLSNRYVAEYVRGVLNEIDNEKSLAILAVQCESLLRAKKPSNGGGA